MNKVFSIDKDEPLKQLVAGAEPGEQVELTVDGKVVAKIVPEVSAIDPVKAKATIERIRAIASQQTLGGLDIKELINEGRK